MKSLKRNFSKFFAALLTVAMVITAFAGLSGWNTVEAKAADGETVQVEPATSIEPGEEYIALAWSSTGVRAMSTNKGNYDSQRAGIVVSVPETANSYSGVVTDGTVAEVEFSSASDMAKCIWEAQDSGSDSGLYIYNADSEVYLYDNGGTPQLHVSATNKSYWKFSGKTISSSAASVLFTYSNTYFTGNGGAYSRLYHVISDDPEQPHLTVNFNSNGGSTVDQQSVMTGKKVKEPETTQEGKIFKGWYSDEALTTAYDFDTAVNITEDSYITLYAKWADAVTVTFNSNGGSAVTAQTIEKGIAVSQPENPTKSAADFVGWYSDEALTTAYDFTSAVNQNTTLYAKWNKQSVYEYQVESVTDLEDGEEYFIAINTMTGADKTGRVVATNNNSSSNTVNNGNKNYRETKLYTGDDEKLYISSSTSPTTETLESAKWLAETNSSGGFNLSNESDQTGEVKKWLYPAGTSEYQLTLVTAEPAKGWTVTTATDPAVYVKNSYHSTATYSIELTTSYVDMDANKTVLLYKVVDPNAQKYTISFVSNGGSEVASLQVKEGKTVKKPTDPEKTGAVFAGWYKDSALTQEWNFAEDTVTENTTLYAKWSEAKTVSFDVDGGSAADDIQVAVGGKLSEPATTKDGYRIEGWYKESAFENKWNFETDTVTSDMTLYVKWEEIPQVLYEVEPVDELEDGEQYVITNTALTNSDGDTGYALTSSPYGTYSYNRATRAVKLVKKDGKLYIASTTVGDDLANAVWDAAEGYYLSNTYNDSKQYVYGAPSLYATTSTPSNKWTVTASTTNGVPSVKLGTSYGGSYSLSVGATNASMASYTNYVRLYQLVDSDAAEYKVTFDPNGGEFDSTLDGYNAATKNLEQTVKENKKAKTPAEPEMDGYSLAGWYTDAEGTTVYDFSTPVTEDVILYAKWQPAKDVLVEPATKFEDGTTYIVMDPNNQMAMSCNKQGTYNKLEGISATLNAAGTKIKFASETDYDQCAWNAAASGSYHKLSIDGKYLWIYNSAIYAQAAAPNTYTSTFDVFRIDSSYGLISSTGTYAVKFNYDSSYNSFDGIYQTSVSAGNRVKIYEVVTEKYDVSFVTNNDDVTVETQEVKEGKTATKPDDIVKNGSIIEGWYTDEACTNAYDFSTPVTENITLYAKWKTAHTVTFEVNGGTPSVDAKDYPEGAKIEEPSVAKKNYDLEGWYTDEACTAENKWNFDEDTLGTANMTLYANWTAKEAKRYKVALTDTLDDGEEYFITSTTMSEDDTNGYAVGRNRNTPSSVAREPVKIVETEGRLYLESNEAADDGEIGLELDNSIWKAKLYNATTGSYQFTNAFLGDERYLNYTTSSWSSPSMNLSQTTTPNTYAYLPVQASADGKSAVQLKCTAQSSTYYLNVTASTVGFSSSGITRIYQIINPLLAEYTVTYNCNGGSAVASVTGYATKKLAKPADPEKDGYFFGGWYKDEALTQEWDFSTDTVTANTTLYAKWNEAVTVDVKKATKLETGKTYIIKAPSDDVAMTSVKASNAGNSNYLAPGDAFINSTKDIISFENSAALEAVEWTAAEGTADGYVKLQNDGKDLYQYYDYAAAATVAPIASYTNNFKLDESGKLQSANTTYTAYRIAFYTYNNYNYFSSKSSLSYMADVYEVIPEHTHNYVKHEAKDATCEEAGTTPTYWQCNVCGKTYADEELTTKIDPSTITVTPALGHAWGEWKADEGADTHTRVCANDSSHTETEAHAWDNGKVTKKPTATTHGVRTYTCNDCGATKTEDIVTLCGENTSSEMTVTVQEATSISAGKQYLFIYNGYAMANGKTKFTASYGSTQYDGLTRLQLSSSGANEYTFDDEDAMNAVLWTAESGTVSGTYSFKNADAGYVWAKGTTYNLTASEEAPDSAWIRNFTLNSGKAEVKNTSNGYYISQKYGEAFSSAYDNNATVYEIVSKEGGAASHNLTKVSLDGKEYYQCSKCGKLFTDALGENEAKMITFSKNLTLRNSIDVNIYTTFLKVPDNVSMKISMNGEETTVEGSKINEKFYKFNFSNLDPRNIGDTITATVTAEIDGEDYTGTYETSIKEYCMTILNKSEEEQKDLIASEPNATVEELRSMLVDVLYFGAETQNYVKYKTDELATDALTEAQQALATEFIAPTATEGVINAAGMLTGDTSTDYKWKGANVYMENSFSLRFYFTASSLDNLVIQTNKGNFTENQFHTSGSQYYVEISNISADAFADEINARFIVNGEQTGKTVHYSMNTYVDRKANSEAIGELAKRLYNYGKSAYAYSH